MIRPLARLCFSLCVCLFPAPALLAQAASAITNEPVVPVVPAGTHLNDPQVLLPLAMAANNLDDTKSAQWHVSASYESFGDSGELTDKGTFEQWQVSPDKWKRTYNGTHFQQTEYGSAAGRSYETDAGAPPWPLSLIAKELTHPMPESADMDDSKPELRDFKAGSVKLSCLMLAQPLKKARWPLGLFPTYCFNPSSTMLRLEFFDGSVQAVRNQMEAFHGVYLAQDIAISDESKPLLHIHLTSISIMTESENALVTTQASRNSSVPKQVDLEAGTMRGNKIRGANPQYPEEARRARVQGTVILRVIIDTDGRIQHLRVVSSPDESLSIAAIAAVERWVYRPYTVQGKPIRALTEIDVVFNLGV